MLKGKKDFCIHGITGNINGIKLIIFRAIKITIKFTIVSQLSVIFSIPATRLFYYTNPFDTPALSFTIFTSFTLPY